MAIDPVKDAMIRQAVVTLANAVGDTDNLPNVKLQVNAAKSQLISVIQVLNEILEKLQKLV